MDDGIFGTYIYMGSMTTLSTNAFTVLTQGMDKSLRFATMYVFMCIIAP